ncbi:MAG TPA: hypothetical protein VD810_06590, partial [Methylophilaceae bacterium]|nr:hypothetical protein [Methylophilaceae bacterium]
MSSTLSVLRSTYTSCDALAHERGAYGDKTLGIICYSIESVTGNDLHAKELPLMRVYTPVLSGSDGACEVWLSNAVLTPGSREGLHYRYSQDLLFGIVELDEANFPASASGAPLQQATEAAYKQILTLLGDLDYPFIYRFWNYMAD